MSDNICFPAKLMHGHIMDLIERKVDRIFYPYSIYEHKEDPKAHNSYNCPVVAGYSDVIRSSMETEKNYGIALDSPSTSFNNINLLKKTCINYLHSLGVNRQVAANAFQKAWTEQQNFVHTLAEQNQQIFEKAKKDGMVSAFSEGADKRVKFVLIAELIVTLFCMFGFFLWQGFQTLDQPFHIHFPFSGSPPVLLSLWVWVNTARWV